ncbi:hypothetical protein B0H11DRAFT_2067030 [Mycena galericulata]|nr:hypothetical protein B0H11DRAFT_2067030 [Mycena galericulata]
MPRKFGSWAAGWWVGALVAQVRVSILKFSPPKCYKYRAQSMWSVSPRLEPLWPLQSASAAILAPPVVLFKRRAETTSITTWTRPLGPGKLCTL